jgi:hypothetical protein
LAADQGEINPSDRDERFASLVEVINVDGETLIGLSPVGQLFHETFCHRFEIQKVNLLPPDSRITPEEKKIKFEDQNRGKHPGLETYLKGLREIPYVIRNYTHYYNPDLPTTNYFKKSSEGLDHIEGGFSDGKATTKFDLITTAKNTAQRDAVLADLMELKRTV